MSAIFRSIPGLLGAVTLGAALLALGCTPYAYMEDGGGDPCAGDPCAGDPCGACDGGDGDPLVKKYAERWEAALNLDGDGEAGRKYFVEKTYDANMPCAACHSFDQGDTMTSDGDGLVRPAVSIYAVARRTSIKPYGSKHATLGGNLCVTYWQDGPKEGAESNELADITAFLAGGGGDDHATASNIDYKARKFTVPETLTGGDAEAGGKKAVKFCNSCHQVGDAQPKYDIDEKKLKPGVVPSKYLGKVAKRIKDKGKKNNDFMPGFPDDRMSADDLRDILAWFEKK